MDEYGWAIGLDSQGAVGATISAVDEVRLTRFVHCQPDIVADSSIGEAPIWRQWWWRTVVYRLAGRLGEDDSLIQKGRLRQVPCCRGLGWTFETVLLGMGWQS
jgi:hypothetical protein